MNREYFLFQGEKDLSPTALVIVVLPNIGDIIAYKYGLTLLLSGSVSI